MKPEIKKQIILHLPYLAFVYLFGKVGQAFRLAQGADLSAKLLHIGQGFSAAFASAAPSFHPTDLLIGLAAAVIIRLVPTRLTSRAITAISSIPGAATAILMSSPPLQNLRSPCSTQTEN